MNPRHIYVRSEDVVKGSLWMRFPVIYIEKIKDIPADYPGPMGVPITFIDKFNPEQFELLGRRGHLKLPNGRECYQRIFVRNLRPDLPKVIDLAEWFSMMGMPLDIKAMKDAGAGEEIRPEYRALQRIEVPEEINGQL